MPKNSRPFLYGEKMEARKVNLPKTFWAEIDAEQEKTGASVAHILRKRLKIKAKKA